MRQIVRIGLDIAKRWFQVRSVDETEKEIFNRKLPRKKVLGVPVKTVEHQAASTQHTSRQLVIDQRTAAANSLRSQFAEFGVIEKRGVENLADVVRSLDETIRTSRTFRRPFWRS
jgi:transposase